MVYITTVKGYDFDDLLAIDFGYKLEHNILVYIKRFGLQDIFMRQITAHFDKKLDTSLRDVSLYIRVQGKDLLLNSVQSTIVNDIGQLITVFRDIEVCSDIVAFLEYVKHINSDNGKSFFNVLISKNYTLYEVLMYLEEYFIYDKIMERMKKELKYY